MPNNNDIKYIDMRGKKFGSYLVISDEIKHGDHRFFLCRCDCGAEKECNGSHLRKGHRTRCRECSYAERRFDFTGKTFGEWNIVKEVDKRGQRRYFLCQCDCGLRKEVRGSELISGRSTSCGHASLSNRDRDYVTGRLTCKP